MNIFETLNDNNYNEFLSMINNDSSLLETVDEQKWNLLSICIYDNLEKHVEFLLSKISPDLINKELEVESASPLYIALEGNNKKIIDLLVSHENIDLNIKCKNGESPLFYAIDNNDINLAKKLINKGIDLKLENNQGINAISHAITKNKSNFLDLIDTNELSKFYNDSWILSAIKNDDVKILKMFFNVFKDNKDKLFENAVGFKNIKSVAYMLDSGEFIPGEKQITSIIDLMCQKYDKFDDQDASLSIAEFLFSIKVPFNKFKDENGKNAWMLAIENNNDVIFNRLLAETAEHVNHEDSRGETPLFYAIENGNFNYVKSLLKRKANPNQQNSYNETPLIKAVRKNRDDMVDELLKYPTHINKLNSINENALSIAIHYRMNKIISKLIWAGGDITTNPAKYIETNDAYHITSEGTYEKLFSEQTENQINDFIALAKLGFNLNQVNNNGDTFIHHFIKEGYLANYKAILNCSLNFNIVDAYGNTPVMNTVLKKTDDYFFMILAKNSYLDLTKINKDNKNIYDLALESKKDNIIERLVDYDTDISLENAKKVLKYNNDNNLELKAVSIISGKFPPNLIKIKQSANKNNIKKPE